VESSASRCPLEFDRRRAADLDQDHNDLDQDQNDLDQDHNDLDQDHDDLAFFDARALLLELLSLPNLLFHHALLPVPRFD
jgi:hypothetical protein